AAVLTVDPHTLDDVLDAIAAVARAAGADDAEALACEVEQHRRRAGLQRGPQDHAGVGRGAVERRPHPDAHPSS
ncbi:MAG: hypothetical protein AVDCRST_MAG54-2989, partial [uncultured Actinomycetospora sp.]